MSGECLKEIFVIMEIQLINDELLAELRKQAQGNERKRQNFDLRTSPEDTS